MKFTAFDAVIIQKHIRIAAQVGEINISQAYEIASEVFTREAEQSTCGTYINNRNQRVPIRGTVLHPFPEKQEPKHRVLMPVSIDALCEVDGDVDLAMTHDEVPELLTNREPLRVAGEDREDHEPDDEEIRVEAAADAALEEEEEDECRETDYATCKDDSSTGHVEPSEL
jgi:hypothetical protein